MTGLAELKWEATIMTRREQPAAVTVEPLGKEKTGDTKKKFPKENPNKPKTSVFRGRVGAENIDRL